MLNAAEKAEKVKETAFNTISNVRLRTHINIIVWTCSSVHAVYGEEVCKTYMQSKKAGIKQSCRPRAGPLTNPCCCCPGVRSGYP